MCLSLFILDAFIRLIHYNRFIYYFAQRLDVYCLLCFRSLTDIDLRLSKFYSRKLLLLTCSYRKYYVTCADNFSSKSGNQAVTQGAAKSTQSNKTQFVSKIFYLQFM